MMSTTYLQLNKPPWRYLASAAVLFALVVVFFVAHGRTYVEHKEVFSGVTRSADDFLDDIHNHTLGFQKILAISLPERTDHRDGLTLASAVSDLEIAFVNGVHGDGILEKVLPPGDHKHLATSTLGSWRAHLNALVEIVHNNYSSALIVEDDVDWDVRLKTLLKDFALSHNALEQNPNTNDINFESLPPITRPKFSPYGDSWDLLWLGHCGMHLPPTGLVIHRNDPSVPEAQYLHSWDMNERTPLAGYLHHTRVVLRQSQTPVCSLAYAVSQSGARKILYSLGLRKFDSPYDVMLRAWCQGSDGNERHVCPGVLPQIFDHYRRQGPKSADSDISKPSEDYRDKEETLNIRWSVRLNMDKILRGDTNYDDQYPDTPAA